jgi:hypothetical protein
MLKTATFLVVGAALSAADLVAVPFALSAVTLTGDWGDAQRRNQEVLLSLNMTSWSCQFTNTANLTSCASDNCIAPGRAGMPSCIPLPGEMSLVRPQPCCRKAWRGLSPVWTAGWVLRALSRCEPPPRHHTRAPTVSADVLCTGHWLSATALLINATSDELLSKASAQAVNTFAQVRTISPTFAQA